MKVLCTGGAGFIGSNLVKRLLKDGHDVVVVDNLVGGRKENLPLENPRLRFYETSILDDLSFIKDIQWVFHLAAIPKVQESIAFPEETNNANITGTLKALLLARKLGVSRFIYSSSSSVYGDQPDCLPYSETLFPRPMSPYALQKLTGEEYCFLFTKLYGLPTLSLRYFNVYGPGMSPDGDYARVIPKFIKELRNNQSPIIHGDGEQTRDFTYVDDVVRANLLAAESDLSGEAINIGSGVGHSMNHVGELLLKAIRTDVEIKHGPPVVEPKHTLADIIKAKSLLGWKPQIFLDEGIKTLL